nr:uncharacterized protein LOC100198143 isoform X1 [Hydra vulgaris]
MMSDDLVFPPPDAFSFMHDLSQLQDHVNDINPAFPMPEQLNIPELVPHRVLSPRDEQFHNISHSSSPSLFTPISNLIKQTQQHSALVENPIICFPTQLEKFNSIPQQHSTNELNIHSNFVNDIHGINNKVLPNELISKNPSSQNSQYIVAGNQHISMQPHKNISNMQYNNLNTVELSNTSNHLLNINSKQPQTLKLPSEIQTSPKPPLKGQIVKTADQKLMFVTEVNGKRVGYLIQQSKPSLETQQSNTLQQLQLNTTINQFSNSIDDVISGSSEMMTNQNLIGDGIKSPSFFDGSAGVSKKQFETDRKESIANVLREKFHNLRHPLYSKNQYKKTDENTTSVKTPSTTVEHIPTINRIMEDLNRAMEVQVEKDNNENIFDEEGQEIEFSENDLTYEESLETEWNKKNDVKELTNSRTSSTDDEDSLPLSKLKFEEDLTEISSKKKGRKAGSKNSDLLPLSQVAAKLRKEDDTKLKGKKKEKTKAKKMKKDSRAPVKPILAYQLFFREVQTGIKKDHPELGFGEVSKMVAQLWEALSEDKKNVYHDKYNKDKNEYSEKLKQYKELIAKEGTTTTTSLPVSSPSEEANSDTTVNLLKRKGKKSNKILVTRKKSLTESDRNANQFMEQTNMDMNRIEFNNDEISAVDDVGVNKNKYKTRVKNKSFESEKDIGSSPSLPSSDSSDDDVDDEDDPTISRIRQKAAELKEKINREKLAVRKQIQSNKPVKMEVETVSEGLVNNSTVEETIKQSNFVERFSDTKSPPISKPVFKIPKKSSVENGVSVSPTPRLCIRVACGSVAKTTRERGGQYCSNECLVLYCRFVMIRIAFENDLILRLNYVFVISKRFLFFFFLIINFLSNKIFFESLIEKRFYLILLI